ncbi:MAG TPA: molybdenum cofactor guanylyltransferase [Terracidiphilus sp.]|nr:molybdenum cofactor guanylyltransferase [Terracidiphilus sp.]
MPIKLADEFDAAGIVLAGGQSSRMGRDKALLPLAGRPLIAHAVATLRGAGLPVTIAGAGPEAESALAAYAPVVPDREPGLGPLSGICAALAAASSSTAPPRYLVFLPVDLPLLPSSLISCLLHHAQITGSPVTIASINAINQTFPAVLDRSTFPALHAALHSQKRGCLSAFQSAALTLGQSIAAVPVELLVQSGQVTHPLALPPLRWFLNVNTPQDLRRAESLCPQPIA